MGSQSSRETAADHAAHLDKGATRPSWLSCLCFRQPYSVHVPNKHAHTGLKDRASTKLVPPSITLQLQHGTRTTSLSMPSQDFYPLHQLHAMRVEAEKGLGIDSSTHRITGMFAESTYAPLVPFIMIPKLNTSDTPYRVVVRPVSECSTSLGVACRPEPVRPGHAPQVSFSQLQRDVAARKAALQQSAETARPVDLQRLDGGSEAEYQPTVQEHDDAVSQLFSALQQVGYIRLEVQQPAAMAAVCAGVNAMHNLMQVPMATQQKLITRVGSQFVGFSEPGPRRFYQVRRLHTGLPFLHRPQPSPTDTQPSTEPISSSIAESHPTFSPSTAITVSPSTPLNPPHYPTPTKANPPLAESAQLPTSAQIPPPPHDLPPSSSTSVALLVHESPQPHSAAGPASPQQQPRTGIDKATSMAAEAALIDVYDLLREAAVICLEAIALGLHMDPARLTSIVDDPQYLPWVRSSPDLVPLSESPLPHPDPTSVADPDPNLIRSSQDPTLPSTSLASIQDSRPSPHTESQSGQALPLSETPAIGSDVFRAYHYFRPPGTLPPMLRNPATGLHCDMGLLAVSPLASLPGLAVLHPSGSYFMDVETACADPSPKINTPLPADDATPTPAQASSHNEDGRTSQACGNYVSTVGAMPVQQQANGHNERSSNGQACVDEVSTDGTTRVFCQSGGSVVQQGGLNPSAFEQQAVHGKGQGPAPLVLLVFGGEALGLVTGGAIRAPVHYVDERFMGTPRVSLPFFLRPRPNVNINLTNHPLNLPAIYETSVNQSVTSLQEPIASSPALMEDNAHARACDVEEVAGVRPPSRASDSNALQYKDYIEKIVWRERPWARVAAGSKQDY